MIRILFVDDDDFLLEALRRILRNKKDIWDMDFVNSGKKAIELIGRNNFNIIVSDCSMPEMDGFELLTRVRDLSPGTKRILLSGRNEAKIPDKLKEPVHVFISKLLGPEELIAKLEETTAENK